MHLFLNTIGFIIFLFTLLLLLIFVIKLIIFMFQRRHFPKKLLITTLTGFALFLAIFVYIQYFFTFNAIDKDYIQNGPGPVLSPTEKYMANAYYEPYGGAGPAGGVNVWIEITNNEDNTTKTVYYADAKSQFSMEWIDEATLSIINNEPSYPNSNRSVKFNIEKEIYHENGLACQSLLLKKAYEKCYQN